MKNKERKKELIQTGVFKDYRQKSYELYKELNEDYEQRDEELIKIYGAADAKNMRQMMKSRKKVVREVKRFIDYYAAQPEKYNIYFATFTYDDKKRRGGKDLRPAQLREYITKALKDDFDDYCINVDYGKKNGRLHFHGILVLDKFWEPDIKTRWTTYNNRSVELCNFDGFKGLTDYHEKVGFTYIEKFKTDDKERDKTARYIAKLTLHSVKEQKMNITKKRDTPYQYYKDALEYIGRHTGYDPEEQKYNMVSQYDREHIKLKNGKTIYENLFSTKPAWQREYEENRAKKEEAKYNAKELNYIYEYNRLNKR